MTRQFDVFHNPSRSGRVDRPFILIVQAPYLDHLKTRVGGPLVTERALRRELRLNPELPVQGQNYYFSPTELVTFPLQLLHQPVTNLEAYRDRIIAALDLVFTGI